MDLAWTPSPLGGPAAAIYQVVILAMDRLVPGECLYNDLRLARENTPRNPDFYR
jgi:hypothetical protein